MSMDCLIKVSKLLIGAWLIMIVSACTQSASPNNSPDDATLALAFVENSEAVDGLIEEYCIGCHNFEDYSGGIDLEGLGPENIHIAPDLGEKVIKRLRAGMMPPVGEPRPDVVAMQALASALENTIDSHSVIKPGRPGLHRLNRSEYQNAIRDLFGM